VVCFKLLNLFCHCGGRTKTRTLDPLIKSQLLTYGDGRRGKDR